MRKTTVISDVRTYTTVRISVECSKCGATFVGEWHEVKAFDASHESGRKKCR